MPMYNELTGINSFMRPLQYLSAAGATVSKNSESKKVIMEMFANIDIKIESAFIFVNTLR